MGDGELLFEMYMTKLNACNLIRRRRSKEG